MNYISYEFLRVSSGGDTPEPDHLKIPIHG